MANEIKAVYISGRTIQYKVKQANGSVRVAATALPEVADGCYVASNALIVAGDIAIITESGGIIGSAEYQPGMSVINITSIGDEVHDIVQVISDASDDLIQLMIDASDDDMEVRNQAISDASDALIINGVWDEPLTGTKHNIPTSAGRRIRELGSSIILSGTSPGSNTVVTLNLDGDAGDIDGLYDPGVVSIIAGKGTGQSRQIFEYDGPNRTLYLNRDWKELPDNTSEYLILAHTGDTHVNEGRVLGDGGGTDTIQLNALASSTDDIYIGQVVFIVAGPGADQANIVKTYDGASQVATMHFDWKILPVVGDIYTMMPYMAFHDDDIFDFIVEEDLSYAEMVRIMFAVLVGKVSGGGSSIVQFRDLADQKDRVTALTNALGDRLSVAIDGS
jgi:hypothetical protein